MDSFRCAADAGKPPTPAGSAQRRQPRNVTSLTSLALPTQSKSKIHVASVTAPSPSPTPTPAPEVAVVEGAAGSNLHAAVSAMVEKVKAQSDAIADFYAALEAGRRRGAEELLVAAAKLRLEAKMTTAAAAVAGSATQNSNNTTQRGVAGAAAGSISSSVTATPAPQQKDGGGLRITPQPQPLAEETPSSSSSPPTASSTSASAAALTALKSEALARGVTATRRDHTTMVFSKHDALHEGEMRRTLGEALGQLASLEETVLPALEARIIARRAAALQEAEHATNAVAAKAREAEAEEDCVDAAIWEAETVLGLLSAQAATMRGVIGRRSKITETGLEALLAMEATAERRAEEEAARAAADMLRRAADF